MTVKEISQIAGLGIQAQSLATDAISSPDYLSTLKVHNLFQDAVRFRAHDSGTSYAAIQWALSCVKRLQSEEQQARGEKALDAVNQWLLIPSDAGRWTAKGIAQKGGINCAGDCLAMAVFLSGGSISPIGAPQNNPPQFASEKMAAAAVVIAVLSENPQHSADRYQDALGVS
jgi:hypothetical protein